MKPKQQTAANHASRINRKPVLYAVERWELRNGKTVDQFLLPFVAQPEAGKCAVVHLAK